MKAGFAKGARGEDVGRLHRVLASAGFIVNRDETDDRLFGPSTLAALHALQRQRGVAVVDELDGPALDVLLEIERNVGPSVSNPGTTTTPKPDEHHGRVTGNVVDGDGAPLPGIPVAVFAKQLRSEKKLGDGKTNARGAYVVTYHRHAAVNLVARAYDDSENVIATSATVFAAEAEVEINLTTAKDRVVRALSRFTALREQVTSQLEGTPLADLKESKDSHEVSFIANAIGARFADVAYLFMAHALGTRNALRDETLFGIFYGGIPAALGPALTSLPDAGIDDALLSQVLTGVLAHSRAALGQALTAAVSSDVLPASYSDTQDLELTRLDDLRVQATSSTPYIRGKTPLSDLLTAGAVPSTVRTAFLGGLRGKWQQAWPDVEGAPREQDPVEGRPDHA